MCMNEWLVDGRCAVTSYLLCKKESEVRQVFICAGSCVAWNGRNCICLGFGIAGRLNLMQNVDSRSITLFVPIAINLPILSNKEGTPHSSTISYELKF